MKTCFFKTRLKSLCLALGNEWLAVESFHPLESARFIEQISESKITLMSNKTKTQILHKFHN